MGKQKLYLRHWSENVGCLMDGISSSTTKSLWCLHDKSSKNVFPNIRLDRNDISIGEVVLIHAGLQFGPRILR